MEAGSYGREVELAYFDRGDARTRLFHNLPGNTKIIALNLEQWIFS